MDGKHDDTIQHTTGKLGPLFRVRKEADVVVSVRCILKLGTTGTIFGFDIDTTHFNGKRRPGLLSIPPAEPPRRAQAMKPLKSASTLCTGLMIK